MLKNEERQKIYADALAWTKEAGKRLKESLYSTFDVQFKTSSADLVTEKDREIEQFLIERIKLQYPDHLVLGEEGMFQGEMTEPAAHIVWVIDPIDGTTNFVHQKQDFCVSVAVYDRGQPCIGIIYDPIKDELFHALAGNGSFFNDQKLDPLSPTKVEEALIGINCLWLTQNSRFDHTRLQALVRHVRGTRSIGSAALEMAYVACGRLDAYLTLRLSPWDYAAGLVILKELGAKASKIDGEPLDLFATTTTLFVVRPGLHDEIFERFLTAEPPQYPAQV
jgi:myo-inositol-1(or 4)-monophosphatase